LDQRHKVVLQVCRAVLLRHRAQRLDGLVPDDRLLDGREALERRQQAVSVLGPADQGDEGAQLLGEGQQHLVLVVDGLGQEGDQLGPRALHAQRQGYRRQLLDGVEP
jgi:hypothetical protein